MSKFKVGNKVKCIENIGAVEELTKGKIYEIMKITNGCFRVVNDNENIYGYFIWRFKIVEKKIIKEFGITKWSRQYVKI